MVSRVSGGDRCGEKLSRLRKVVGCRGRFIEGEEESAMWLSEKKKRHSRQRE